MDVDDWRSRIDEIDGEILQLISKRAEVARRIGQVKMETGLPPEDPAREEDILRRLTEINQGLLDADAVRRIFSLIIAEIKGSNQGGKGG
ncbi:chorismate mutase [candidate division KSB1 bacterium]